MKKVLAGLLVVLVFVPFATFAQLNDDFESIVRAHGLDPAKQAACARDMTGRVVSFNEHQRMVPASVSKLYLFDFALSKLPVNFRYVTSFYVDGTTLYINGAGDPQMITKHLATVFSQIETDIPDVEITDIVISPHFYFEWETSPSRVRNAVRTALDRSSFPIARTVSVRSSDEVYSGTGVRYQFESIPLPAFLKLTSNYSNNFYSDVLFEELGGAEAFADYLLRTYGVGPETASFTTGSGLSGNYTTCGLTLRVLDHLDRALRAADLSLTDVMSVPVVDPGVMASRSIEVVDAIVAKSGYVRSHRNLAGIINSDTGPIFFAIFTTYPPSKPGEEVTEMVDSFTNQLLTTYRPRLLSFDYNPDLSIFQDYQVWEK